MCVMWVLSCSSVTLWVLLCVILVESVVKVTFLDLSVGHLCVCV